jgi:hypothetical protein
MTNKPENTNDGDSAIFYTLIMKTKKGIDSMEGFRKKILSNTSNLSKGQCSR